MFGVCRVREMRMEVSACWRGRNGASRRALAFLFIAGLAGCSAAPNETRAGYEAVSEIAPATDGRTPMAELPVAAGAVVALVQSQVRGVLTQRIVLRGDPGTLGENAIVVKVDQSRGPSDLGRVGTPTRSMIAQELDENFAGVDMQLSQTFARNGFGPFGYAIGHPREGVTCIYAWQWSLWKTPRIGEAPTGAPSMPVQPTSVRVRLCRSSLGEAEILPLLRDMQVYPQDSRVAYLDPNSTGAETGGDALAAAGVGYFVVPGATPRFATTRERLAAPHRHAHRKVVRRVRHRVREAAREERAVAFDPPSRDSVAVPMPAGGAAPTTASMAANPLLAPLAAASAPRARSDDMPLPRRAAATDQPSSPAPRSASIPLPN